MSPQFTENSSVRRYSAGHPAIQTEIGQKTPDLIRLTGGAGRGLFGPYIRLGPGPCIARILINGTPTGHAVADIVAEYGRVELVARDVDLGALDSPVIELQTVLPRPMANCEIRLYCSEDVCADISAVEIETPASLDPEHRHDLDQRLRYFRTQVAPHVEGWLGDRMHHIVRAFDSIFSTHSITGHIAEIGVHHGLSFFLFSALRSDAELCFAIDLFEDQHLNIDHSGSGSLDAFVTHLDTLLPIEKPFVKVLKRDSLTFSLQEFTGLFAPAGVKLFSVDGGHTALHVCNDLTLVQEVLVPGGIVALDDFFGPHWPDVTAGFYQFLATRNRRLSPLLIFQNKLFLTTASEHGLWLENLHAALEVELGEGELRGGTWKYVDIAGTRVLAHG